MNHIFVVNAGSSSLKFQLVNMDGEVVLASGNCERIGIDGSFITYKYDGKKVVVEGALADHKDALAKVVNLLCQGETKVVNSMDDIIAIGHRVVLSKTQSTELTDEIIASIEDTRTIAPLHVPAMVNGIHACRETFGTDKLQVGVFDNSFHLTMPEKAYIYAIPYEYYEKYGIRRFGYHGTSHRYVSLRLAELMGKKPEELKIISCHLGNGSSITAIDGGKSIDTTMGYTPLSGLLMGTRSGDIDPSIILHIAERENLDIDQVNTILNKKSGLLGISGLSSDARDVVEAAANGHKRADLACHIVRYQIKKYIGAYTAAMGGLDAVIFTGGMGENSDALRAEVCENMSYLGIEIDEEKNKGLRGKECDISSPNSKAKVWVIPTNEELMIARDAYQIYCNKKG